MWDKLQSKPQLPTISCVASAPGSPEFAPFTLGDWCASENAVPQCGTSLSLSLTQGSPGQDRTGQEWRDSHAQAWPEALGSSYPYAATQPQLGLTALARASCGVLHADTQPLCIWNVLLPPGAPEGMHLKSINIVRLHLYVLLQLGACPRAGPDGFGIRLLACCSKI